MFHISQDHKRQKKEKKRQLGPDFIPDYFCAHVFFRQF